MSACTQHGFTLVEILIVIAVMSLLTMLSVTGMNTFATQMGNKASVRIVTGALSEALAQTLSANNNSQYGVHFDTSAVTIFIGDTYVAGLPSNDIRTFQQAEITDISLSGGVTEVVFERLRGNASATGTITVTQTKNTSFTRTVTIYSTGLNEIN